MKKGSWMVCALLAAALCACTAAPASSGAVSAVSQGGAVSLPASVDRYRLTGDGERLWLLGWGADGLRAWQSGDGGESWREQALDWPAGASPLAVESLLPDGRALVAAADGAGQRQILAGGPEQAFAALELPALNGYDGCAAACWVDGQTLSLTPSRYEQFLDDQGQAQRTVAPLPVGNVVCRPGEAGTPWGDGPLGDRYGAQVSDGEQLYCVDWEDSGLVTLRPDGSLEKGEALEGWTGGPLFAREGRVYYLTDRGVRRYPDTDLAAPAQTPWTGPDAVPLELCVTDRWAFVLWTSQSSGALQLYRWPVG